MHDIRRFHAMRILAKLEFDLGFKVGPLDSDWEISGARCFYLYPDLETAIVGEFRGGVLVGGGRMGRVEGVEFAGLEGLIAVPKVVEDDKECSGEIFRDVSTRYEGKKEANSGFFSFVSSRLPTVGCYCYSTIASSRRISKSPLLRDAFEALRVEARRSEVTAAEEFDAGEGLFALRDLRRGSLVALYGGVRLPSGGWAEDDEFTGCRVRLNGQVRHK